jgi:hypothetical protein
MKSLNNLDSKCNITDESPIFEKRKVLAISESEMTEIDGGTFVELAVIGLTVGLYYGYRYLSERD